MLGPYVHDIDPVIATVGGVHLWWYGLSYSVGFLNAYISIRRRRADLGLTPGQVLDLAVLLAVGVLVGGRLVTVFHERAFYADHLALIPAVWLGGMATHGLIIGGFIGVGLFCAIHRKPYREVFDALAIPTAMILAVGRVGNFIDGQIVGSVTAVPWSVKFPEAEGFRHPVVLYDGVKNLLIVPALLWMRRRGVPPGRVAALFLFLYAFLRLFIDLFREYPLSLLGLPAGQAFNVFLAVVGFALLVRNWLRARAPRDRRAQTAARSDEGASVARPNKDPSDAPAARQGSGTRLWWRRSAFAACLLFPLVIPSDATRDVPTTYAHRHPGVHYTSLYISLR
jgi:phosphatidylglycerol:prolipoprotein diacylglycerol transferase